jgi:hypothetical protein
MSKFPRFEIVPDSLGIHGHQLWLVLSPKYKRHIESRRDRISLYDLADSIKNAAIVEPKEDKS